MAESKLNEFESIFHNDLMEYLLTINRIDSNFPDAPDIQNCWAKIGESYLPDGLREFNKYPTVSLGWIMYVGMAVAKYWDEDWEIYSKVEDIYKYLRDKTDFDHMDDYICEHVLLLDEASTKQLRQVVAECASRTCNKLLHLGVAPGSADAYYAYIAALHQLYLMGSAMQLKHMGYHMTKIN